MRAVALEDVRLAWRVHRKAHESLVAQFEKVVAARSMDEENAALRDLLGLLIISRATAAQTAADLTGVQFEHDRLELPLELLYPPIIDTDHEEVDPNSTP